jgi:hypothetical protein
MQLICPTCQNVFAESLKASMPVTTGYFAWGCFRYFGLEAASAAFCVARGYDIMAEDVAAMPASGSAGGSIAVRLPRCAWW